MKDKWHWLRHKYSIWTPYLLEFDLIRASDGAVVLPNNCQLRQQRHCIVCGKRQDKAVADTNYIVRKPQSQPQAKAAN